MDKPVYDYEWEDAQKERKKVTAEMITIDESENGTTNDIG